GLVVNYDLPDTAESLTHRVGRTARMGNDGCALTFVTPDDAVLWRRLRSQGGPDLPELDLEPLVGTGSWQYAPAVLPRGPRVRPAPRSAPAGGAPARARHRGRRRAA